MHMNICTYSAQKVMFVQIVFYIACSILQNCLLNFAKLLSKFCKSTCRVLQKYLLILQNCLQNFANVYKTIVDIIITAKVNMCLLVRDFFVSEPS